MIGREQIGKHGRIDRAGQGGAALFKWSEKSSLSQGYLNGDLSAKRQLWKLKGESKCEVPDIGTSSVFQRY